MTIVGHGQEKRSTVDTLLCWWLVLGLPPAWEKGSWHSGLHNCHQWIGTEFFGTSVQDHTRGVMKLPIAFLNSVLDLVEPLTSGRGSTPLDTLLELVGKCGRTDPTRLA